MDRFVRENFDPTAVHDVGRIYHGHGAKFLDFADQISKAAGKTEQTWQGQAGDAMRQHVGQLAEHMSHSGNAAQLTANQIGMQAEAGERARNSMPEVVEFDMKQELKNYFSDPNPFTAISRANDIVEKQEKSQAAHAEAAQVMSTMEGDFGQAAAQTPAFVPAPREPEEVGPPPESRRPIGRSTRPPTSRTRHRAPSRLGRARRAADPAVPRFRRRLRSPARRIPCGSRRPPVPEVGPTRGGTRRPGSGNGAIPTTGTGLRSRPASSVPGPVAARDVRVVLPAVPVAWAVPVVLVVPADSVEWAASVVLATSSVPVVVPVSAGSVPRVAPGSAAVPLVVPVRPVAVAVPGWAPGAADRGQGGNSEEDNEHESKYVLDTDEAWDDLGLPKVAPPVFGE